MIVESIIRHNISVSLSSKFYLIAIIIIPIRYTISITFISKFMKQINIIRNKLELKHVIGELLLKNIFLWIKLHMKLVF